MFCLKKSEVPIISVELLLLLIFRQKERSKVLPGRVGRMYGGGASALCCSLKAHGYSADGMCIVCGNINILAGCVIAQTVCCEE